MANGRKALVVGINYYEDPRVPNLSACVKDAYSVDQVLERNSDGTKNFDVILETATDSNSSISRHKLKELVKETFKFDNEISLFYFSGHGYMESTGGYITTSDSHTGDDGLSMHDLLTIINDSPTKNKIVIIDACHSGEMGNITRDGLTQINNGVTIMTASRGNEYAMENREGGIFTRLFVDALNGSAANLLGQISPASIYSHIDQSLGDWEQRPIFKTNVQQFVVLRRAVPPIPYEDLVRINSLFIDKSFSFPLDPTYEPESGQGIHENMEKFAILQKYNRVNLVVPEGAPHMYHAAMESKSCRLTVLGEHYWTLLDKGRL